MGNLRFRFGRRHERGRNQPLTWGGRIGGTLFFLVFFLMGSFFEVMVAREFLQRIQRYTWEKVPCRIMTSQVDERGPRDRPYSLVVAYAYEYGGKPYQGSVYAAGYRGENSYNKTSRLAAKYPEGRETVCYLNRRQPTEAVLDRGSLWFGFVLLFPLIFVGIGLIGIIAMWQKDKPKDKPKPKRASKIGKGGGKAGIVFFGLFALVGLGVLFPTFILPVMRILDARSWTQTPCRVIRSEVRSHSSDDGTTYSVHILYEYEFDSKKHRSDRYTFMGGSSSGYKGKRRVVDSYPAGKQALCWVNPERPHEAVLKRGFTPMMLVGLVPLIFLAVGVGGIFGVLRRRRRKLHARDQATWLPDAKTQDATIENVYAAPAAAGNEPVVLRPKTARWAKCLGLLIFALFWNGICSILFAEVIEGFREGDPAWGMTLFSIPFALVGLGVIIAVIYQLLAVFNPRIQLQLGLGQIALGQQTSLAWQITGRVERLQAFSITLIGREQARYRRGTKTYTDKKTFHQQELFQTSDALSMAQGQTTLAIPAQSMHSFKSDNNQVIWSLVVEGDVPRWPDVKDTFEIVVPPMSPDQIKQLPDEGEGDVAWAIPVNE